MSRVRSDVTTTDFYKQYKKRHKDTKLTSTQYITFVKDASKEILQHLLEGNELQLGNKLGNMRICTRERNVRIRQDGTLQQDIKVDFGATNKLRKELQPTWSNNDWNELPANQRPKVYHDNEHTDGCYSFLKWYSATFHSRKVYRFVPNRYNLSRPLAKILKSGNKPAYYKINLKDKKYE